MLVEKYQMFDIRTLQYHGFKPEFRMERDDLVHKQSVSYMRRGGRILGMVASGMMPFVFLFLLQGDKSRTMLTLICKMTWGMGVKWHPLSIKEPMDPRLLAPNDGKR